jgi:hypothetical protein
MHLRSEILELLTMQQAAVAGDGGRQEDVKGRDQDARLSGFAHLKVLDVLFSEFVVQF